MKIVNVFDFLKSRGYIAQASSEAELRTLLNTKQTFYEGFDPSAASFHLGTLESLMVMYHLQRFGHRVIFLLGGATGRVGDPTGKNSSRKQLTRNVVSQNAKALKSQVEKIGLVHFARPGLLGLIDLITGKGPKNPAIMLNNDAWLSKFKFMDDFLMRIARHFSVNDMIRQTTFAERLRNEKQLSLLEFCYAVLQAWDFLHLFNKYGCKIQMGGNDQWANILHGTDLIRLSTGKKAYGLTFPLLTTPDGQKMGKTEAGPVWLDPRLTSPYDFYQYLIKVPDSMLRQMLFMFTFLPAEEINALLRNPREAQRRLAFEVTKIVHGEDAAKKASGAVSIPEVTLQSGGENIIDLLVRSGCVKSKSDARRLVVQGAVSIGDIKITNVTHIVKKPGQVKYGKGKLLRVK